MLMLYLRIWRRDMTLLFVVILRKRESAIAQEEKVFEANT